MNVQIEESWKQHLAPEFEKDYFVKLTNFVRQEYQTTTVSRKIDIQRFQPLPF